MTEQRNLVLTIGHSTHSVDVFIDLLKQHRVSAVADLRSAPFSRFNPQFNRNVLGNDLKSNGIEYVFLGRELGARSNDLSCYENGRVKYALLARTDLFRQGIERVIKGSQKYQIALMCAEREPLECHRSILVARALDEQGVSVSHILGNGTLETYCDAMKRLLNLLGLPRADLFRSRKELIADALARQEEKIAYIDEKLMAGASGDLQ